MLNNRHFFAAAIYMHAAAGKKFITTYFTPRQASRMRYFMSRETQAMFGDGDHWRRDSDDIWARLTEMMAFSDTSNDTLRWVLCDPNAERHGARPFYPRREIDIHLRIVRLVKVDDSLLNFNKPYWSLTGRRHFDCLLSFTYLILVTKDIDEIQNFDKIIMPLQ